MNKRIFTVSVLVSVIAIASLFSAYVSAPQSQGKDVVTIRMNESSSKKASAIYVVEGSESRTVDLEGNAKDDPVKNFKIFSEIIENYVKKGYQVNSATTSSYTYQGNTTRIYHDYVLVK